MTPAHAEAEKNIKIVTGKRNEEKGERREERGERSKERGVRSLNFLRNFYYALNFFLVHMS